MSFELHPSVETDLEKASDYYLKKAGRVIASRFLEEFYRAAVYLAASPEIVSQADA